MEIGGGLVRVFFTENPNKKHFVGGSGGGRVWVRVSVFFFKESKSKKKIGGGGGAGRG